MTKDETLLVFTLVVSSVSVFLFRILLFMILISATRDFSERTKSKLVKIMIWAGIVVITFAIAVRIYPIFIFLLKERIKPLVEALYEKLPWIWEVFFHAIEVGIHLSLLSNLFWILKTTLAGFLGSFRLYLVYFGFYCLLFSERWLRTSEDRGERQAQICGILLRGMLIE
ncbi:hypothetical protein BRADI_3g18881v3 [Brachypodium distachyon]|uniref:Uncharacterized protein n=1 Tax=Brachypodium distachyon TaxID=15368 RepID=A0A0Q3I5A0_BRADI|nr:hypothetical protein BRADI_3g18881v3 [Brachypodium distachyon]